MFHMSPSQGSLLHESVARSRELGRSIGRKVARSLGIRWGMREGRRGGKGGAIEGLREKKRKTQGRPTRIERGVLIVKKRFLSSRQTQLRPTWIKSEAAAVIMNLGAGLIVL